MPIITEHHVNFYDTDAMAVVHHSNYIRWFETGRVAYLRKYGICRICFRELAYKGQIPGVKKASW